MFRPIALPFVALLAIASAACAPASNADEDPSHPDWLVGTLTGPDSLATYSEKIELDADGAATSTDEIDDEDGIEDHYVVMTWSFDGKTLTLGGTKAVFGAGCHLVEVSDPEVPSESMTYVMGPSGPITGCPQSEPALSHAEHGLVDTWAGNSVFVVFDESRYVRWDLDETTHYYRWGLDDDDTTIHITNPDGEEEHFGTLTFAGNTVTFCATDSPCKTLTRFKV